MTIKFNEFGTVQEMEDFINDLIVSKPLDATAKYNVRALTLTFTTPAVTIAFPDTEQYEHASLYEIAQQIETQSAGRATLRMHGQGQGGRTAYLAFIKDGDVFTGGTAKDILGLGQYGPGGAAGTVGANKIIQADIVSILTNPQSYSYIVGYTV